MENDLSYRLSAYDFSLTDLNLYLDSHPNDTEALERFNQLKNEFYTLREQYVSVYGPLTATDCTGGSRWMWIDSPWPWEIEGDCN